ncbi:MAG: tRNA pseudouridine(38-40) synthase TruA [Clostridiales bacterium]|nr:tRNA pseudouridine(38-40) synthase TruA [Clostridiales bacterium]
MSAVALIIEFDGTDFVGWQYQENGRSVQDEIQKVLSTLYKEQIKVTGSSRTDAGVHARGIVCSAKVPFDIPCAKLPLACNALLPDDVSVVTAFPVTEDFNARFDSLGKRYIYRILHDTVRHPLQGRYTYYVTGHLDVDSMVKAAPFFEGAHDFASFCASGGSQNTTMRRLNKVEVRDCGDGLIEIEVDGEAFLYNMVRIIAGTLLYVGQGKYAPEDIPSIIASCDRERAGKTLPPEGLTLEEVKYDWERFRIPSDK